MKESQYRRIMRVYADEGTKGILLRLTSRGKYYLSDLRRFHSRIMQKIKSEPPKILSNKELNASEAKSLPLVMKSKPVLVYAEAVTHCNLQCTMCRKRIPELKSEERGFMSLDNFKKLTDILEPGSTLSLFGRGETLMHPDYPQMLKMAKEKKAIVCFNSNGKALSRILAEKMVEYGQDHFTISFSAGTEKTYEKIHVGGTYNRLIANIKYLNETKDKYNSTKPVLGFEFVAMRQNIEELPRLIKLAKKLSVSNVIVIHLTSLSEKMAKKESLRQKKFDTLTKNVFQESSKLAQHLGISLVLPEQYDIHTKKLDPNRSSTIIKTQKSSIVCLEPWETFYVNFKGEVMPCVITNRSLGNLNEQSAEEIWNGVAFQKFRERSRTNNIPPECTVCHLIPGKITYDLSIDNPKIYKKSL